MRVANIRIGVEKEIRRVEVPSVCEVWQEGGERIKLGEVSDYMRRVEAAGIPGVNPASSVEGGVVASGSGSGSGSSTGQPLGLGNGVGGASGSGTNGSGTTSVSSPTTERKRSFASRRPSFLKRRGSSSTSTPTTVPQPIDRTPTSQALTLPQLIIPEVESPPLNDTPTTNTDTNTVSPTSYPNQNLYPQTVPLALDATDVHLLGELKINVGTQLHRTLVQSFSTPEIAVNYVVEVGLQPHQGAVREAFEHVWGGGVVEVVLGRA